MKKIINYLIIVIIMFFVVLPVKASSDYYKNISISFNHEGCDDQAEKEVTIQLFADGKKVEGAEVTLNKDTGYTYTYENLQIFETDSPELIRYEVKLLEDGVYKLISEKRYTHETGHIQKWVQILPEDIKAGHTYVITTDNWNYESNGFSKTIYLRGDVTAKGAAVVAEYNVVDGKNSYYIIDGEPIDNTKWTVSDVPTDGSYPEEFIGSLIFTNESGKRLALSGFQSGSDVNFIFRHTSKVGWVDSDNSWNAVGMTLIPVEGSKGRFYIGTKCLFPDPNNMMQYLTLSGQNQYQAGSDIDRAAQFKAYEYVDKDVDIGETVIIEETLCEKDTVVIDKHTDYKRNINVSFNCSECESKKEEGITIQLFADDVKVEDGEVTLNNQTGFDYVYEDLPVFADGTLTEINYEVKVLNDGKYYSLPEGNVTNRKETIQQWMQVLPEDIKEGHTYVLSTENLNYESNGFSRYIYLRGDITAKGATIETQYNVIDDKKTYYVLNGEPIENSKWVASKVPEDDPYYDSYPNHLMFTNEEGKRLALSGFQGGSGYNFIYRNTSKSGWADSDNSWNANRVMIIPVENSKGTFYIGTNCLLPEPDNMMQYITLSDQNQYQAGSDINNATQFMAYEYIDREIIVASEVEVKPSLCEALSLSDEIVNPKTGFNTFKGLYILIILFSVTGYIIMKKKELLSQL